MTTNEDPFVASDRRDLLQMPSSANLALAAGLITAVVLYIGARALCKSYSEGIFLAPFIVGVVVGLFSATRPYRNTVYVLLLALLVATVTLQEGVVCCLMALPLVLPLTWLGALCGHVIRRHVRGRKAQIRLSTGAVVLFLAFQAVSGALDDPRRHPLHQATSTIALAAPPDDVFAALTDHDLTVEPRWQWFLRIGLPMPSGLHWQGRGRDAGVQMSFSSGQAFGHVTDWKPGRTLALSIDRYAINDLPFHITRLGRGPHYGLRPERVDDWMTIEGIRYDLAPADGRGTRLTRRIIWRRHLAPAFYFAWLQQTIVQRGQDRLLDLLRDRLEQPAAATRPAVASGLPEPGL